MRTSLATISALLGFLPACIKSQPAAKVSDTAQAVTAPVLSDRVSTAELARLDAGEEIVVEFANYNGANPNADLMNVLNGPLFAGSKEMPRYTSGVIYKGILDLDSTSSRFTTRMISAMENVGTMKNIKLDGKPLYSAAASIDSEGNALSYGSDPQDDAEVTSKMEERVILARIPKAMTSEFKIMSRMVMLNEILVTSNYIITSPAGIAMDPGNLRNRVEFFPYKGKWLVFAASAVNMKLMASSEPPLSLLSKVKAVLEYYKAAAKN